MTPFLGQIKHGMIGLLWRGTCEAPLFIAVGLPEILHAAKHDSTVWVFVASQ